MAMTKTRMTVEEFLVAVADIHEPAQLIDGVIVVDQPRFRHQDAVGMIYRALLVWTERPEGRGHVSLPLDVIVDGSNMFGPDVLWYADESRMQIDDYQQGMPDLVVEVSSPSTWRHDLGEKREMYELHGLPELWLVDTIRCDARVLRRSRPGVPTFDVDLKVGCEEVLTSPQLPGFELPLDDVFRF